MRPLNYATLDLFRDGAELDATAVMDCLKDDYGTFRSFRFTAMQESLMAAEKNDLLERTGLTLDESGDLRVYYRATDYGRDMITRYIR